MAHTSLWQISGSISRVDDTHTLQVNAASLKSRTAFFDHIGGYERGMIAQVGAYCTVIASLPFWLGASFMLLALLIGSAGFLRDHVHKTCAAKVPELWYFVDEVQVKGLVAFASLCMSVLMHRYLRSRVARIQRVWGSNGPALEAVVSCILRDPQPEVDPDQECSICLGALDGEGAAPPPWRQLRCGHLFHEECLVEWLGRARHCPLCRHNLHMAYLE
mmetsp:Transcript_25634/g.46882  ORF Transcript_25634/g.46882 Transcript_25634/m.46882 type:complete len:218 (-) Transcript_25634:170-823(-)